MGRPFLQHPQSAALAAETEPLSEAGALPERSPPLRQHAVQRHARTPESAVAFSVLTALESASRA